MEGVDKVEALVFGEIESAKASGVNSALAIAAANKRQLRMWICSLGGDVGPALAMYDMLQRYPSVEAIATGECQSAALIVLLGARRRLCTPNTIFLNHAISAEGGVIVFPEGLRMPALEELKKLPQGFFDAQQALECGLVQGIYEGDVEILQALPAAVGVN